MNRREFCAAGLMLLSGCGSGADEMGQEFTLQPSPIRSTNEANRSVPGYKEGSWLPAVGGSATYTQRSGSYTKEGRLVYVEGQFLIAAIGTGSTTIVSGLPFDIVSGATAAFPVLFFDSLATAVVYVMGQATGGTSITFQSLVAAATVLGTSPLFGNGTSFYFAGTYRTY